MKIETMILARKDGTVTADVGGEKYTFKADAGGALVCEVENPAHIAALVNTGNFYPADGEDFETAAALMDPVYTEADGSGSAEAEAEEAGEEIEATAEDKPASPAKSGKPGKKFAGK